MSISGLPKAGGMNLHGDFMHKLHTSVLFAGAAAAKKAAPPPLPDPRIGVLEQQLRDVEQQLAEIKGSQGHSDYSAAVVDLKRSTSSQYVDLNNRFDSQTKVGLDNGRLTVASAEIGRASC